MKTLDTPADFCEKHNACAEGMAFAAQFSTLAAAWDACHRADWMLWAMQRANKTRGLDRPLRIFACDCAEAAKPADPRSLAAIAVARRYADGLATVEELRAAYVSAFAAYAAARASARAAACAAHVAPTPAAPYVRAAARAYARSASDAAYTAARASAYATSTTSAAATRRAQAKRLRALIHNPFATA